MVSLKDEELEQVSGGTQIPYLVKAGDTLVKLAAKYHCSVEQLCRWNNIKSSDPLQVNQKLVIRF